MDERYSYRNISATSIEALTGQYGDHVPAKLMEGKPSLDFFRYEELPQIIAARKPNPYITKDELSRLMTWKLAHGKFRPNLQNLVKQNDEDQVKQLSKSGFAAASKTRDIKAAIDLLSRLRGVGPATASLLLSVYEPGGLPFFSDELFRWCLWQSGSGQGWDRKIAYSAKEYTQLFESIEVLRERLAQADGKGVSCLDVERAAYVLGKTAGQPKDSQTAISETAVKPKAGAKRKATDDVAPPRAGQTSKAMKKEAATNISVTASAPRLRRSTRANH